MSESQEVLWRSCSDTQEYDMIKHSEKNNNFEKKQNQDIKLGDSIFIYPSGRKYTKILTMLIFGCWEYGLFKFSSLYISELSKFSN